MRRSLVLLLPLLVACSGATEPDPGPVLVLGAIAGYHSDDPQIEVVPLPNGALVSITTYGGGCHRAGETEVEVHGLEAVITPYDYTVRSGGPCTLQLLTMKHEARVTFAESGIARIIVLGLDHRSLSAANMVGDTLHVERTFEIPGR